jgi:hypothetical protein
MTNHGVECSCPACNAQTRALEALEAQQRTNEVESPSHELATLRPEPATPDEGRERLRAKLQQPIRPGLAAPVPPPRYDEVFADGVAWLREAESAIHEKIEKREPAVGAPRLRRGDVVRVKGSALVEIRYRLGEVLDVDVNGGEVLVNVATAQGPQRYWLFVEQVEKT